MGLSPFCEVVGLAAGSVRAAVSCCCLSTSRAFLFSSFTAARHIGSSCALWVEMFQNVLDRARGDEPQSGALWHLGGGEVSVGFFFRKLGVVEAVGIRPHGRVCGELWVIRSVGVFFVSRFVLSGGKILIAVPCLRRAPSAPCAPASWPRIVQPRFCRVSRGGFLRCVPRQPS